MKTYTPPIPCEYTHGRKLIAPNTYDFTPVGTGLLRYIASQRDSDGLDTFEGLIELPDGTFIQKPMFLIKLTTPTTIQ